MKDRMKAAVARLRMTADDIKEMVEHLRMIADLPDPVGAVTSRWERPDGLQVSRVRVPIGVIGVVSELSPLVTVESIALCFKSGNVCVFRGAPEWNLTQQAIGTGLREAAEHNGVPAGAWIIIERPDKEVAVELMRSGKSLDAIIPRGGAGLRKAVTEQAKMPVLCNDGGLTHMYVDADTDMPMAQNVAINSKVQKAIASNSLDTLLVQQVIGRQFLPPLVNRMLERIQDRSAGLPEDHGAHGPNGHDRTCFNHSGKGGGLAHQVPVARDGRQNGRGYGRGLGAYRSAWTLSHRRHRDHAI